MNTTTRNASLLLGCTLALACSGGERQTIERPVIVAFTATPIDVAAGGTTMLRWEVTGARSVQIDTEDGTNVLPATANQSGSVVSPTLAATTVFVLSAANEGGLSTMMATVTVGGGGNGPTITSFTANPMTLNAAGMATLSWQTTGGNTLQILANNTSVHNADATAVDSGSVSLQVDATTTYTLLVGDAMARTAMQTVTVTVGGATQPTIDSFAATPATIPTGGSSTLGWTVRDATSVTIADSSGTVVTTVANLMGTVSVTPAQTETYTLTASDANGAMATAMTTVTVNAAMGAQVVSFTATPQMVNQGGTTTLAWNVNNAPEGIDIIESGNVVTSSNMAMGTFMVTPAATTTYQLVAKNAANGDDMASVMVTVVAPGQPVVSTFTANPVVVAAGGTTTLSWTTVNADQVRILDGATVVATETTNVASGSTTVTPTADTTYTIEATLMGNNPATATVDIFVHAAPVVNTFTVTPTTLAAAGLVTVTWDVANVSSLGLTLDGAAVGNFPTVTSTAGTQTSNGSIQVQVAQTSTFQLNAMSAAGTLSPTQTVTVNVQMPNTETEPNDDFGTANMFPMVGGIAGTLTADDLDFFTIDVPMGGNVTAQTSDGMGGCATDTVLFLAGPGGTVIASDDNDGTGNCSLISPTNDAGASDLLAGTYFVVVRHSTATGTGNYELDVTVGAAACGNDIIESNANEQCDGGNTTAGDGCNAACQIEIHPTVLSGTGGTVSLNFPAGTDFQVVQVNVAAGQSIAAVAADVGGTTCNTVDTAINLANDQLLGIGGKADGGPVGTAGACASLIVPTDQFNVNLEAGTYYLVVFAESGTGNVQLTVSISNAICGNSVFETNAGEQCDDGNTNANDGCNATCQLEVVQTVTLPSASPIVVSSALGTLGELDTFQITVTTETFVRVETFAPTVAAGCNEDTFLVLRDANQNVLGFDDEGGTGSCSRMDELQAGLRLAPGTYYAQVFEFSGQTIAGYEVRFESVAIAGTAPIFDTEPNDAQASAQVSGLSGVGTVTLQGRLNPSGDDDVWAVTVPANQDLVLIARTHDVRTTPTQCGAQNSVADTRVFIEQAGLEASQPGTLEVAYNDDADLANDIWCSAVGANVSGGATGATYYVRVQGFADAGIRAYFLTLQLQTPAP
ncbi:MAG: hypothetical protein RMA76_41110 [Deltaproteobacteria bacterium]|jgi:cysteine-rich repeat protein